MDNFEKTLFELIEKTADCNLPNNYQDRDFDLIEDLNMDSMKIIQLIMEIEETFNIEISDENLVIENLRTYAKLKDLVIKKLDK